MTFISRGFLCLFALTIATGLSSVSHAADEDGWQTIFDGKTLKDWDGDPRFWSVEDGAITGKTTKDNPTSHNTFIIWKGGEPGNFELKCDYKIIGHNSGIQYRSFIVDKKKWIVGGYQADLEAGNRYSGILYGEKFRGILADRGQKTEIGANHKPKVLEQIGDSDEIQKKIKKEDWNSLAAALAGGNLIYESSGMTASLLGASFEAFVLDDEMHAMTYRVLRGVEVSDENLDVEAIRAAILGDGHFLGGPQTLAAMERDYHYPNLADRSEPRTWAAEGAQEAWARAKSRVRTLLAEHQPNYLSSQQDAAIQAQFRIRKI